MQNEQDYARLGLAIATRVFRTAVARNRVKRIIRESFRLHQSTLPAVDITVSARDAARSASAAQLRASLAKCWKQIGVRA